MSLSTFAKTGLNVVASFKAIVEITKALAIEVEEDTKIVLNTVLTIGGVILGAFISGARAALTGGLIGSTIAELATANKRVVKLADYLLSCLPERLRENLVTCFKAFLVPFQKMNRCYDEAMKMAMNRVLEMKEKFLETMKCFLDEHCPNLAILPVN